MVRFIGGEVIAIVDVHVLALMRLCAIVQFRVPCKIVEAAGHTSHTK